jgi:DEAD/DEAH box helicase domain-containing protein
MKASILSFDGTRRWGFLISMLESFQNSLDSNEFIVVDSINLPARAERRASIPSAFEQGRVGSWLSSDRHLGSGLWLHQAKAMAFVANGTNVVVSTGTASGKLLVFQARAFQLLDRHPEAAILVFYPLKALQSGSVKLILVRSRDRSYEHL